MPRPSKPKRVCGLPRFSRFFCEERRENQHHISLTVEEYETIRFLNILKMLLHCDRWRESLAFQHW